MSQLHETRIGQEFLDKTVPELVGEIKRLNGVLERIAVALEKRDGTAPSPSPDDER